MIDLDRLIREADPARGLVVPAVDPAELRRLRRGPARPRRRPVDALVVGAAAAVAVAVAAVVLLVGGQRRAPLPAAGRAPVPAAAEPLARILGVLRRPQTAADRAAEPAVVGFNPLVGLVRLAAVTPWGQKVIFFPQKTADSLGVVVSYDQSVNGHPQPVGAGNSGITARGVEAGEDVMVIPAGSRGATVFIVVPDGVARVAFVLAPNALSGPFSGWAAYAPLRSRVVTVPVHNNVAFVPLYHACCGVPMTRWYAPDGRLIKVTNSHATRVATPQILSQASAARPTVLDVLHANGIAGARFGASRASVRATIDTLLHQNGGAYEAGGSCGLDHQITWIDQGTASGQPTLTVYFRHSAFAGYQVGVPGAPRYPRGGWALATTRGLKVGDKLARGRRLYGDVFSLSSAQGGTWQLRTAAGQIDGYAWGTAKYGDVSWQSVVATIDAGDVGCPAIAP